MLENLLGLYPGYNKIYGPYVRKDLRSHIVIRGEAGMKTISYPKAIMESHLSRRLEEDETVDNEDDDVSNNSISNLQIMSRADNAKKGHKTGALKSLRDNTIAKYGIEALNDMMRKNAFTSETASAAGKKGRRKY